jgi:hypothetical protein
MLAASVRELQSQPLTFGSENHGRGSNRSFLAQDSVKRSEAERAPSELTQFCCTWTSEIYLGDCADLGGCPAFCGLGNVNVACVE